METEKIVYYHYPDGSIAHLHYPGGHYVRHDYTARGQLAATGWDDDENNWWMKLAHYTYLSDGKVGQIDFGNGVTTGYGFDQRGFIQIVDHYRPGLQDLSWRQYWRDNRDRITAFQKSYNPGPGSGVCAWDTGGRVQADLYERSGRQRRCYSGTLPTVGREICGRSTKGRRSF